MPTSTFADRLAYLRWRWAAGAIKATDLAFAQSLGVGEKWYAKWKVSDRAPGGRDEHKAIATRIGAPVADWLYDGEGEPPEPELWVRWKAPVRAADPPMHYGRPVTKKETKKRGRG